MNRAQWTMVLLVASAVLALGMAGTAYAFHSGGVAECIGCHTMHGKVTLNETDGKIPKAAGEFLLFGTDVGSTCLNCHNQPDTAPSSYHISTDDSKLGAGISPVERTPGGDFAWLKKTYNYTLRGSAMTEEGATHGHNIQAADYGYTVVDGTSSPGGSYPSAQLTCNSCHDPHGKYRRLNDGTVANTGAPIRASGSYNGTANEPDATTAVGVYRLLAGSGYAKKTGVSPAFPGVPAAKAPSTYNQREDTAAHQVRVAYGILTTTGHATWSDWCQTCHAQMHPTSGSVHPVDQNLGSTVAGVYNSYVKTGDMTGDGTAAYTSLVPFMQAGTYADLAAKANNNGSVLTGPTSSDQVSCLSCHRAHASGWEFMLRWNPGYEFLTQGGAYITNGTTDNPNSGLQMGRTGAEMLASYYDRPASTFFATYQRSLCNKCHAKD